MVGLFSLYVTLVGLLLWAAIGDVLTYRIPNNVVLAIVATFGVAALVVHPSSWWSHLASGSIALVVGFLVFQLHWLGGGDAKLWAAAALWSGLDFLPTQTLTIALAGGALSVVIVLLRGVIHLWRPWWAVSVLRPKAPLPYGVAIAAGTILTAHHSPVFLLLVRLVGWA